MSESLLLFLILDIEAQQEEQVEREVGGLFGKVVAGLVFGASHAIASGVSALITYVATKYI
jgi:hypothetical protein